MSETMTRKEMFELAKKGLIGEVVLDEDSMEAILSMFDKQIAQLSKKREPKVNTEAVEFAASVATYMSEHEPSEDFEGFTNKMLAEALDVSPQKMAAALRRLVGEGAVERQEPETAKGTVLFHLVGQHLDF